MTERSGSRARANWRWSRRRFWPLPAAALVLVAVGLGMLGVSDRRDPEPSSAAPAAQLRSRPDLRPPGATVEHRSAGGGGLIFLTPRVRPGLAVPGDQHGPMIVDDRGRVVWFAAPPRNQPAADFRVQEYRGEPVLTWWQGAMPGRGSGAGEGVIVDRSYRRVATVRAGGGLDMDLHEFLLTPRGTALITIFARARRDLTAIGGARDAQVTQGIVQEIDVATGRVLFEWRSLDHVAPSESYRELPSSDDGSYDYFHINSVEEDDRGDLLVSGRHTSAVYKIDKQTGAVVWRLGGTRSDFAIGPGADFGQQHDARYEGRDDVVRIFDNVDRHESDQPPSSVKVVALDEEAMTATLVRRLDHPDGQWAESQANAQRLPDGGLLVGWGSLGGFARFDRAGRLLLDGHLPERFDSYRAYMHRWIGAPTTRPSAAAVAAGDRVAVYASWNGATRVRAWQVLAGAQPGGLRTAGRPQPWSGLETAIPTPAAGPYFAVRALDGEGRALATSKAVRVTPDER